MDFKNNLTLEDFKSMSLLESEYYDENHITPYNEAYRCYLLYPWSTCSLWDGNKVVGFLDMFPINDQLFNGIKSGKYNDTDLTANDVLDISEISDQTINMFLSCIVVDKNYRKTDALKLLFLRQIEFYSQLIEKGIKIDKIITDNVTKDGERFSLKYGFQKERESDHDSVIYISEYRDFISRIEGM